MAPQGLGNGNQKANRTNVQTNGVWNMARKAQEAQYCV
jgi:hypothetical protein